MGSANLTLRQLEILIAVVAEMKPGEINWEAVAPKAKCSSAKYARDQFAAIRKLLQAASDNASGDGGGEVSTPKTKAVKKTPASKRKKAADENDADAQDSPTKKKKATPRNPKSATPGETKEAAPAEAKSATPAAEPESITAAADNNEGPSAGNGNAQAKTEPTEARELMDAMADGA